jgi:hypothetical protein
MLFYFAINPFSSTELKKLKCMFHEKLSTEFLFLKEVEDECVTCSKKCLSLFVSALHFPFNISKHFKLLPLFSD